MTRARLKRNTKNGHYWVLTRILVGFLFLLLFASIGACTRQSISLAPGSPGESQATDPPPAATLLGEYVPADRYSVVWVPKGETLKIHNPAGPAGTVIGELDYDQNGIQRTGGRTSLGSSLWVEIMTQEGVSGWVNEWNLTETVSGERYCSDVRIPGVLVQIIRAIEARDGDMLAEYVNPMRGLTIRHDWWNPEVVIPFEQVPSIFESSSEIDWGVISGGEFRIEGSFDEVIRPLILDVVSSAEPVCNELPTGTSAQSAEWPGEYNTLNYSAFYRPPPENGNPFNWRTWTFTFEYIGGRPYLTVLIQYQGDI